MSITPFPARLRDTSKNSTSTEKCNCPKDSKNCVNCKNGKCQTKTKNGKCTASCKS